jgi:glyoxylase-like metal-dependent hydrolase (beta-lactamase superfamily II)
VSVVVTHRHPDQYGGLVELVRDLAAPRFATAGVAATAHPNGAANEILRPMFGHEVSAHLASSRRRSLQRLLQRSVPFRVLASGVAPIPVGLRN